MDIFLNEFDAHLASRYVGLRQDSGDPIAWGEKALKHYQSLNIPSENKIFVFSDSLNVQKAVNIFNHFKGRCRPFFGIGTNLTNDLGYTPLDIVIKMTQVNHKPVIKISDAPGKMVTDDMAFLKKVKELFQLKDA
jgi:nicotinate phosphoribosyltransferase